MPQARFTGGDTQHVGIYVASGYVARGDVGEFTEDELDRFGSVYGLERVEEKAPEQEAEKPAAPADEEQKAAPAVPAKPAGAKPGDKTEEVK